MIKHTLWLSMFACSSAIAVNEYSEISANDAWNTVSHTNGNQLFTSVPTDKDTDAGVISLKVIDGNSELKFQEWPYLDGVHGAEALAILSLPSGRQTLSDGTIIEVGTFELGKGEQRISFLEKFEHTPHIFLSGQSNNNQQAYVTRVHGVSQHGFVAFKQGEEKSSKLNEKEKVAYIAIYASNNTGNFDGQNFIF